MKANNIEVFHNQLEVMVRVKELKELDYKEEDMYIISGDENNISMLRGSTDVMIKEEEGSLWDRFKSFLKGQDTITEAFNRMGLHDADKDFYHNEVKKGKILLYIDKDYGSYYELHESGEFRPVVSSDEEDRNIDNVIVKNEELLEKNIEKDLSETNRKTKEDSKIDMVIDEDRSRIR